MKALHIHIEGAVQGVGFRPFIYRLAKQFHLTGFVRNDGHGVDIEAEGEPEQLETFLIKISEEKPPRAVIWSMEYKWINPAGYRDFEIVKSTHSAGLDVWILPDIATCNECLKEVFDPGNKRYLYPFTNCTNCGPRYSIIEKLPYDRPNTTMARFTMCPSCRAEYENPIDRRYHAQPNACPECGPKVFLTDRDGKVICEGTEAIEAAVKRILEGAIVGVKGIGGFQLMADATNDDTVQLLRNRKKRPSKPFALMASDLDMVKQLVKLNPQEQFWLTSPEAPIVILDRRKNPEVVVSDYVAPGNPTLGIMLPYSPLHHILLRLLNRPVIATSGNLSEEPLCYENEEALSRLRNIADYFLMNDRPIVHPVDDSVMRVVNGKPLMVRRARGFAPLPLELQREIPEILAVGGHLKNTIAVSRKRLIFVSQHIGDLDNLETLYHFESVQNRLKDVYKVQPEYIIHDLHPEYQSTRYVKENYKNIPHIAVQHHHAHMFSVLAEQDIELPALGIIWDGTGYGEDGTIWGGEWFILDDREIERVATFRPFHLPGGEQAIRQPWRVALSLLKTAGINDFPSGWLKEVPSDSILMVNQMLERGIRTVETTSAGRIFDGIAALCGLCSENTYEGEAAISLEHIIADNGEEASAYPYTIDYLQEKHLWHINWIPMIRTVTDDLLRGIPVPEISARFHQTMIDIMVQTIQQFNLPNVIISGGCFQNRILIKGLEQIASAKSFKIFRSQMIPPNDGCISVGQVVAYQWARKTLKEGSLYVSGRTR